MSEGVGDYHCMSDGYIVEDPIREQCENPQRSS